MSEKKKINFTIMSDQKKHKTLDLSSISPVIIDTEEGKAYVDMGALHARSAIEKGIKFVADPNEVPNGNSYPIVWVSTGTNEAGRYYHGLGACKMLVDKESRKGFKVLAEHVNTMDAAMKGRFVVDALCAREKEILKDFLISQNIEMWENSPKELKHSLENSNNG